MTSSTSTTRRRVSPATTGQRVGTTRRRDLRGPEGPRPACARGAGEGGGGTGSEDRPRPGRPARWVATVRRWSTPASAGRPAAPAPPGCAHYAPYARDGAGDLRRARGRVPYRASRRRPRRESHELGLLVRSAGRRAVHWSAAIVQLLWATFGILALAATPRPGSTDVPTLSCQDSAIPRPQAPLQDYIDSIITEGLLAPRPERVGYLTAYWGDARTRSERLRLPAADASPTAPTRTALDVLEDTVEGYMVLGGPHGELGARAECRGWPWRT